MVYYIDQLVVSGDVGFTITDLPESDFEAFVRNSNPAFQANTDWQVHCLGMWQGSKPEVHRIIYGFLQAYFEDLSHSAENLLAREFDLTDIVDSIAQAEQMWAFEEKVNQRSTEQLDLGLHMTKAEADTYLTKYPGDVAGLLAQIVNGKPAVTENWTETNPANVFFDLHQVNVDEEHVLPVMYRNFYPTHHVPDYEQNPRCRYVRGLKYTDYEPKEFDHECFKENGAVEGYAEDFSNLLQHEAGDRFVLVGIPSSKKAKVNVIQRVIQYLAKTDPRHFINGNALIQRLEDGQAAHEGNNQLRKVSTHMQAWDPDVLVDPDYHELPIIVLDDVLTSGASFDAADRFLAEKLNLPLTHIMNFAYAKTVTNQSLKYWLQDKSATYDGPVTGVIFDLDQTLFDTAFLRQTESEAKDYWKKINAVKTYDSQMLKQLDAWHLPYAIVTNNKEDLVKFLLGGHTSLFGTPAVAFGDREVFATKPAPNVNFHPTVTSHPLVLTASDMHDGEVMHPKPDPYAINLAVTRLNVEPTGHLIGVGNTFADMQAYRACGMETLLVNYGNRVKLPSDAGIADHVAETPEELSDILKASASDSTRTDPFDPFAIFDQIDVPY